MGDNSFDKKMALLSKAFLKLKDLDEAKAFLQDLLTEGEQIAISSRLNIAQMLNSGIPYSKIQTETGASSATIAKVSDNLKYGKDGLKLALERLGKYK